MTTRAFAQLPWAIVLLFGSTLPSLACSGTPADKVAKSLEDPSPAESFTPPVTGGDRTGDQAPKPEPERAPVRTYDAGTPVVIDGGNEGGLECVEGGAVEAEPNDSVDESNPLAPTVCGRVSPSDPEDHLTFTLKPESTSLFVNFDGDIVITVTVAGPNGDVVTTLSPTEGGRVPFFRDKPYALKVRSIDGKPQKYRVTLFER